MHARTDIRPGGLRLVRRRSLQRIIRVYVGKVLIVGLVDGFVVHDTNSIVCATFPLLNYNGLSDTGKSFSSPDNRVCYPAVGCLLSAPSRWQARLKEGQNAMNEKTIDDFGEDEISDEAVEAAGTRTDAAAWTFVCSGIQCHDVFQERPRRWNADNGGAP